jgi:hypothetical protein
MIAVIKKLILIFSCLILVCTPSISAFALPDSFSPSIIINDSDFYDLPAVFLGKSRSQSIQLIQQILSSQGSLLASKTFPISFGGSDWNSFVANKTGASPFLGQTVSASELIWMITQESLGSGAWANEPINETTNPLILLAAIQKESGIIYGTCSKETCFDQSVGYRTDRATGYFCYDGTPCDSDFLGFFKQVYFYNRINKAYVQGCGVGFNTWNNGTYKWVLPNGLGNTVTIDGQPVVESTKFACSSYIYTPHLVHGNFFNVIKDIYRLADQANLTIPTTSSSTPISQPPVSSTSVVTEQVYVPPVKTQENSAKTDQILLEPEVKKIIIKRRPVLEDLPRDENTLVDSTLQDRVIKEENISNLTLRTSSSSVQSTNKPEVKNDVTAVVLASVGSTFFLFTLIHRILLWKDKRKIS